MALKRTPRPRDPIQLGKLMVDIATGAVPDEVDDGKSEVISDAKRIGGRQGGKARAESLSPKRRAEIARNAAKIRWKAPFDEVDPTVVSPAAKSRDS